MNRIGVGVVRGAEGRGWQVVGLLDGRVSYLGPVYETREAAAAEVEPFVAKLVRELDARGVTHGPAEREPDHA